MRHTQGPWVAEKAKLDQGHIEIYSGSILVADVMSDDNSADGNGVLNARLIAAAPEMLEVLKAFVFIQTDADLLEHEWEGCSGIDSCVLCMANKIIEKAEGR
jgi:RNase P/RNase MRP subunit p30